MLTVILPHLSDIFYFFLDTKEKKCRSCLFELQTVLYFAFQAQILFYFMA